MNIPLNVVKKADKKGREHVYCSMTAILSCAKPRFFQGNINLMVDTGATMNCCITESDAKLLHISFDGGSLAKLPDDEQPKAWTGSIEAYIMKNVTLRCKGEKEGVPSLFKGEISECHVAKGVMPGLPSVIGTKFLTTNSLKLTFSPKEGIAFLETV
jgi:hypothetical protein